MPGTRNGVKPMAFRISARVSCFLGIALVYSTSKISFAMRDKSEIDYTMEVRSITRILKIFFNADIFSRTVHCGDVGELI